MKKNKLLTLATIIAMFMLHASCEEKIEDIPKPEASASKYVLLATNKDWSGFAAPYLEKPSGEIDLTTNSAIKQLKNARGGISYGKHLYFLSNSSDESGIQKYSVSDEGKLVDEGFLPTQYSATVCIADEETGFYMDHQRGGLKLQIFDPGSMVRTGEIDLGHLSKGDPYETVGKKIIIARDGKLFVDVAYADEKKNSEATIWYEDKYDTAYVAVIDIASKKYESITKFPDAKGLGYIMEAPWSDIDENGDIYIVTFGSVLRTDVTSKILKIPANSTSFEEGYALECSEYVNGWAYFSNVKAHKGKVYTLLPEEGLAEDWANYRTEIYHWYEIDPKTKAATKIESLPISNFASNYPPVEIGGDLYFPITNADFNGYYKYADGKASVAFEIAEAGGGAAQALFELK